MQRSNLNRKLKVNLPLRCQHLLEASESKYTVLFHGKGTVRSAERKWVCISHSSEKAARLCSNPRNQLWFNNARKINGVFNRNGLGFQCQKKYDKKSLNIHFRTFFDLPCKSFRRALYTKLSREKKYSDDIRKYVVAP